MLQLLSQVVEYAKTFLDSHSLETLYYGNLSKGQARQLTGIQFHFQYISIFDFRQLTDNINTYQFPNLIFRQLTDMLVGERADYLERRADELGATVEVSQFFLYISYFHSI